MFGLGIWQLERKAEKDERLLQIAKRQSNQPYQLSEIIAGLPRNSSSSSVNDIQDFPVSFNGQADLSKVFFIDNKIVSGKTGYHVVVPIKTLSGETVLANFGWLRGNGIRGDLPALPIELNDFANVDAQFSGIVSLPSINQMVSETNLNFGQYPVLLQQIDLTQIEKHLSASTLMSDNRLYPFVVNLNPDPNSEFVRNWQAVVMSPEKHLGYAAQWFGLGIAALTIYLLSLMKLLQTKNNKEN
jgi:cytochrome oxidase assembly protein ShyY1